MQKKKNKTQKLVRIINNKNNKKKMENPSRKGKRKRKSSSGRNPHGFPPSNAICSIPTIITTTTTHSEQPQRRSSTKVNRVKGAFVFFDIDMKKRFVNVFGNAVSRDRSRRRLESGQVNHEFIWIGTTKYVIQVVEWDAENVTRRLLGKTGRSLERHYHCKFVAWVLSDVTKQAGITPLAVGTRNGEIVTSCDVSGPAGLLEALGWTVDDDLGLIMANKVFQSVHSPGGRTPTDRDIIQEMALNPQSRIHPERAAGAILARGRGSGSAFLGQRRRVAEDIELALQLMQAEACINIPDLGSPVIVNNTMSSFHELPPRPSHSTSPAVVQQFFNMLPGGFNANIENVLLLSTLNSSSSSRSSGFEATRKEAQKAKKNENINDVSEADLEAFIAMKNQEKRDVKPTEPKARTVEEETCLICFESAIDTVYIPCGHSNCCSQCADTQKHVNKLCPICRKIIISVVRLHKK